MSKRFYPILFFCLWASVSFSQAIVKGGGIVYTNGAPTHTISVNTDTEVAIDTSTGYWWERSRDGAGWVLAGFRVQKLAGSSPPTGAPGDKISEVKLNDADSLYRWRSGAWRHINKVLVYTAGTGISVTGTVIANTGDLSVTNEGLLGVQAGAANTSVISSNTSGAVGVTITAAGILSISESTSSNGGSITLTATEVDGSTSNELQTLANTSNATSHTATLSNSGGSVQFIEGSGISLTTGGTALDGTVTIAATDASTTNELQTIANTSNATSHTVTLSNSGGSIQLVEGSGITLTTTGTGLDGIVTIASTGGGGATDLSFTGTSSPVTLNSSTGADVTITAGSGISLSASSGNITITATGGGGANYQLWRDNGSDEVTQPNANFVSTADVSFALTNDGANSETEVTADIPANAVNYAEIQQVAAARLLGNPTGSAADVSEISLATGLSFVGSALTPADASATNELQTLANTSDATSHTVTLSSSGGSVQFIEGSGITLTTGGTALDGTATIAAVDASTSNELQTFGHSGTTSYTNTLSLGGGSFTLESGGIVTISHTTGTVTISATEVDGSTSNELQTIANTSDATSHTVTLSNSGGSVQMIEGSGITLTTGGTGSAGTVTIAATDASTSNELQTYAHSGTTSYTNTLSNGGGSFTLQSGGIVTISHSAGTTTISATEVDGSTSNELQTIANTSDATSHTVTLSNSGGSVQMIEGSGITLTTGGTGSAGTVTIAATDASATNELQTITNSSDATSHTVTLSNSGGSVQMIEGSGITLTTGGTGSAGTVTIAATDASTSNELQTFGHSGTTSYTNTLSNGGGSFTLQSGGIVTISHTTGTVTISATEVDGSTSNELQTITNSSDATSHTVTLSNSGGSVQFIEGSGITLTTGGTGSAGTVTISATGGGANYQLWRDNGSDEVTQPNANFVSTADVSFALTNDGANSETEVTADIPANAVNYAEIQQVAAARLLGNPTGSAADVSEISLATGLSFAGTVLTPADASATNELQTVTNSSDATSHTVTLSNSGGSVQFIEGSGITLTTGGTGSAGTVTIAATDASATNELQTITNTSDATSHTVTLSNSGGSVQFIEGSGITLTTGGTGSAGTVTIAATGGGGGAPTDAQYVTLATNTTLTDERVFTAGVNTTATDAGAGSTLTLDVLGGNQTTSQLTADQDNFTPTNWATRTTHYVSSDASMRAITSFDDLPDGTIRRLINTGSHHIYIPGEHPDGTAANRVITDCDIFIAPNGGVVTLLYDGTATRWRVIDKTFNPASQGVNGAYGHYYNFSVGATITGDWGTLTLVGNNDVSTASSTLLGGYSSNTATSASGQGSWYFTDVQLNPTEYGLTHTVGSALIQITGNLSTSAQRYTAQLAFIPTPSSTTLAVNNSIGIRYTDNENAGNWTGFTRNSGGTESTVDLGVTAATNTGYVLTICVDKANTEARFYINGVFRGRLTSNLPSSGADYGFRGGIWKSVGTTLRDIVTPWATFYTVKGF